MQDSLDNSPQFGAHFDANSRFLVGAILGGVSDERPDLDMAVFDPHRDSYSISARASPVRPSIVVFRNI